MTNRARYITQRNERDLLLTIAENTKHCPIQAIGANSPRLVVWGSSCNAEDCPECVQAWLNEKEGNTGAIQHRV